MRVCMVCVCRLRVVLLLYIAAELHVAIPALCMYNTDVFSIHYI